MMKNRVYDVAALRMAVNNRPVCSRPCFIQAGVVWYGCGESTGQLKKWPVRQSMGRKGNWWG